MYNFFSKSSLVSNLAILLSIFSSILSFLITLLESMLSLLNMFLSHAFLSFSNGFNLSFIFKFCISNSINLSSISFIFLLSLYLTVIAQPGINLAIFSKCDNRFLSHNKLFFNLLISALFLVNFVNNTLFSSFVNNILLVFLLS
ncbi:MAG: hypothetical protein Q8S84_09405 [bacterium]|nr:hypothetical protein [bacterium]